MKGVSPARTRALMRSLHFDARGLLPVVIQDARSNRVLTLCYVTRRALARSLSTGTVHVYRRSQERLMQKGEVSGHTQTIRAVEVDCEGNSLLVRVSQRVAACHAGYFSCYFRRLSVRGVWRVAARRVFDPRRIYARGSKRGRDADSAQRS